MFRLLLFLIVMATSVLGLNAKEYNLSNGNVQFSLLYDNWNSKVDSISKANVAWWLYETDNSRYDKYVNDEFEFDSVLNEAKEQFINKIKENAGFSKNNFILRLNSRFGDYDFDRQAFPYEGMDADSYVAYCERCGSVFSSGLICRSSKLTFANTDPDKKYIKLPKDEAKKFLNSRKNNYGDVYRGILAIYYYKIDQMPPLSIPTSTDKCVVMNVEGKIYKVEIYDEKQNKVLTTIKYEE